MKARIFLLMIFTPFIAFSQEILKADSTTLKKGIYKSYEEFKDNNPSLPLVPSFKEVKHLRAKGHIGYRLSISKKEFSKLGWYLGFCDGHHIYINPEPDNLDRKTEFEKLLIIKPLAYFEGITTKMVGMGTTNAASAVDVLTSFVLDIPMGNISILNSSLLKEILSEDSALLAEFNMEEKKMNFIEKKIFIKEVDYKNYLIRFYSKNKECSTSLRNHMGIFALIDYMNEQSGDKTYEDYYKRVMSVLKDNPYFTSVELYRRKYSNGICKQIGIVAYHSQIPYYIGLWLNFDSSGKRIKAVQYDLNAKKIRVEKY